MNTMTSLGVCCVLLSSACWGSFQPDTPAGGGGTSSSTTTTAQGAGGTGGGGGAASCGDHQQDDGEECDDGNQQDADGCEADCTLPKCGNGIVDPGELCLSTTPTQRNTENTSLVDLALADCNGDERLDAITLAPSEQLVTVLASDESSLLIEPVSSSAVTPGATTLAVGELDGTAGTTDLVLGHSGKFNVLKGDGKCGFAAHDGRPILGTAYAVAVLDLDGKGLRDVVVTSDDSGAGKLGVWANGDTSLVNIAVSGAPTDVAAGDLDGNGSDDVVYVDQLSQTLYVRFNTDGALGPPTPLSVGAGPRHVAMADMDGNDKLDLVNVNVETVTVSLNQGGSFEVLAPVPVGPGPSEWGPDVLAVADLDGDGDLDVATGNGAASTSVLLNSGAGVLTLAEGFPLTLPEWPVAIAAGDLDRDGTTDLVFATATGKVLFLLQAP